MAFLDFTFRWRHVLPRLPVRVGGGRVPSLCAGVCSRPLGFGGGMFGLRSRKVPERIGSSTVRGVWHGPIQHQHHQHGLRPMRRGVFCRSSRVATVPNVRSGDVHPHHWPQVREVFIVHVGGPRGVTSSTDNIMQMLGSLGLLNVYEPVFFLFVLYVEIQGRVGSRLTFFPIAAVSALPVPPGTRPPSASPARAACTVGVPIRWGTYDAWWLLVVLVVLLSRPIIL